jgi:hypothetical protein
VLEKFSNGSSISISLSDDVRQRKPPEKATARESRREEMREAIVVATLLVVTPMLGYADCSDSARDACVAPLQGCMQAAMEGTPADRQACWDAVRACLLSSGCTCPPELCPTSRADRDWSDDVAVVCPVPTPITRSAPTVLTATGGSGGG